MRDPLLEVFASVNPVQGNTLPCAFSSKNVKIDLYISDSGIDQPADLGSELDEDRLSVVFPSTSEPSRFDEVEQDIVPLNPVQGNILSLAFSSKNVKIDLYISDSGIDQTTDLGSELDEDRLSVLFPSTFEPSRLEIGRASCRERVFALV